MIQWLVMFVNHFVAMLKVSFKHHLWHVSKLSQLRDF